ncbi:2-methylaconitate cis-trans-isomerase PrpF [Azospirillum lipoferum]|uniref:4-oxalomesaconate tautomerase n=1 Tax=Azospirillum lipoferum TaxID=193 RepID=A0A5A9GMA4_AZOLI|nr:MULTISPECIES: 4-oxalomesaconate tautomerase [Azospirillum]KAA0595467.1 4-oxalomesaconate tautomerase [Azospirillum lipoferum]MCP1611622.1 2-methylaconitate cis-trans-isomerase PrpF [Azospirillum lipoferum]MDW5533619.1 4-oxalomesaconate tautomerase [Azospirillum sp. NL1]
MTNPMNRQIGIPCVMMRGGTSRGPFFLASDLPARPAERDALLLSVMGAGNDLGIDGIGGGNPLTSKAAIVGPATRAGADVDYLFAQVRVQEGVVDTSPNCGNMLAAVGPFAIESGLVPAVDGVTVVRIHNVNTGKLIEARIQTPGGQVVYEGEAVIDGVPGTAAPIHLSFLDAAGANTGRLLPTGAPADLIHGDFGGIEVSCIDAAIPVMLVRATDLGKTGYEPTDSYRADRAFMARLEALRVEAGRRMGFANAAGMVIPKPVLLAPPTRGGTLSVRYFMPHDCHRALAITGAVATATACTIPGTVAAALVGRFDMPGDVIFEHPAGQLTVRLEAGAGQSTLTTAAPIASILRTARRLFEGTVFARPPAPPQAALAA